MPSNVLITGGCSGLGRCLADLYLQRGDRVTILDVDAARGQELAKHERLTFLETNLAEFNATILENIAHEFDVVICNAGISVSGNFTDIDFVKDQHVFAINTLGHIQLIKELLKRALINDGARLAFINSASLYLPFPIALSYASSKAALDGFAAALESYVAGRKISVTRVYPGPMNTEHVKYYANFAEGKGVEPDKIATRVKRAIDQRKRKVWPDKASKIIAVAGKVMPHTLAKIMYKKYAQHL